MLFGCGKTDGEAWAKDKLGSDAESVRKEALTAYQLAIFVAGGIQPDPSAYLPRPFVVLEPPPSATETGTLRFHRVSSKLDEPIGSASDVKGFAVVRYGIWDNSKFVKLKSGATAWIPDGKPYIEIIAIDRSTREARLHVAEGDGDERVVELLGNLPRTAP